MPLHQSGIIEHAIDAGGADRDNVGIEHYEGQSPIAFAGIFGLKIEDGLLFPGLKPPFARDVGVVVVGLSVAFLPGVKLAWRDTQPDDETLERKFGLA
jgi:hypothetical protein